MVTLDRDAMIRSHTDHWSIASLLEMKIGWLYNAVRRAFGFASSALVVWLLSESTTSRALTDKAEAEAAAEPEDDDILYAEPVSEGLKQH